MDCQKLIVYGFVILVGLYLLKDICGFKIPFIEGMADFGSFEEVDGGVKSPEVEVQAVDPVVKEVAPVEGAKDVASCKRAPPLDPKDLLPKGDGGEVQKFSEEHPDGEGILKGVNYLEATFHAGVNTVGQSLRNANLNLRAEPPNPRVLVSPWMNSTIDSDLARKPLSDNLN